MTLTFSLGPRLATRDVELHLLAFLKAAVAGTRDRAECTNTSGPLDGNEAIALVSGEPLHRGTRGRMGPIPSATCLWKLSKRPSRLTQVYGKSPLRQRNWCRSFSERRAAGLTGENEHG